MKLAKKKTAVAGGVLSLVLAGAGLAACSGGGGADPAPAGSAPSASAEADGVPTGDGVSASGTVRSARVRELGFATGGVVTSLKVKAGDEVAEGDLLGTVDSTAAEENRSAAYTAYVAAQKAYKEVKSGKDLTEAKDTGTGSPNQGQDQPGQGQGPQGSNGDAQGSTGAVQTVAEAYAALVEAKNAYSKAQREAEGTKLYAPFAGRVTVLSASVGQEVSSGRTVLTLTDVENLRVGAEFSEADTTRLKKGQKASVTFDSLNRTVGGRVLSVSPVPVDSSGDSAGPGGGGFQSSSTSVVRYEVLVSLDEVPSGTRVGAPVTVEVEAD